MAKIIKKVVGPGELTVSLKKRRVPRYRLISRSAASSKSSFPLLLKLAVRKSFFARAYKSKAVRSVVGARLIDRFSASDTLA